MFFAIYCCYFFNSLTLFLVGMTTLQGYFSFSIFKANHFTMGLLSMIIYLFTQTLVIFFFTGMGVNIREYVQSKNLDQKLYQDYKKIKFVLFPAILINIFYFVIVVVSGGAVYRHLMAPLWYGILFFGWLIHYLFVLTKQIKAFQKTVHTVVLMIK